MLEMMLSGENYVFGEEMFTSSGTTSWVVPEDVTSISIVVVGSGALGGDSGGGTNLSDTYSSSVERSDGTILVLAQNGVKNSGTYAAPSIGDGGGFGGTGPYNYEDGATTLSGGGGAGGYTGNGGSGANGAGSGQDGSGGGGGGGYMGSRFSTSAPGNVGLEGQGVNGSGGSNNKTGSPSSLGNFGRGSNSSDGTGDAVVGGGGGALSFVNDVSVTPGETLSIKLITYSIHLSNGGVRIIWPGRLRTFPDTRTEFI